ncbi:hypothetical protein TALC_01239 [Thermoplasmatales archaeon BRNA1]|nr:hypothetical protein TALC_01239 [Thermoplasmatales archaeon BRNA1]
MQHPRTADGGPRFGPADSSAAPSGAQADTVYCTECGAANRRGSKFCSCCGSRLRND